MSEFDALYLASGSPRRQALLAQIGVESKPHPVDLDESVLAGESPEAYVCRLAEAKALTAWAQLSAADNAHYPVLGSDTCGVLQGEILGKPRDQAHATAMLSAMSGRTHDVLTAVAVTYQGTTDVVLSRTQVRFRTLTPAMIARYWTTGEPADKAGAYGIQGLGGAFVEHIDGSYTGVVGLPLAQTAELLERFNVRYWRDNP